MTWRKLKHIADIHVSNVDKKTAEGQVPVALCNYTDVYYNDKIVADMPFMVAAATREQVERFTLRAGDVVITKDSETAEDIAASAFVPADLSGVVCGYHLAVVRPRPGVDGRYLHWALSAQPIRDQFTIGASGVTRFGLRYDAVARISVPLPALDEQRAIADHLDRETAEIDRLIRQKERLQRLLRERADSLIHARVTKGLGRGPLRRSAYDWIGDLPPHWTVVPLRKVARLETGHTPSRSVAEYWQECTVSWVTLADVHQIRSMGRDTIYETKEKISELGLANSAARRLPAGTVMLSRTASVGFSAIMGVPMATSQDFANWICGPALEPRYLLYALRAMRPELLGLTMGSTHQTIYMPIIWSLVIPLPPLEEQRQVVRFLDRDLAKAASLRAEIAAQVRVLRERRAALITACVAGHPPSDARVLS